MPKSVTFTAEVCAAGMWWWILWHLWHEYEHITVSGNFPRGIDRWLNCLQSVVLQFLQGEFEYPDPSAWTNKELGIPPDSDK